MIFASSVSSVAKCLSESNASAEAGASAEALLWWSPFAAFGDFFWAGVEVEKLKEGGRNASGVLENCQHPFFREQQLGQDIPRTGQDLRGQPHDASERACCSGAEHCYCRDGLP